jgi:hypothetical protein
MHPAYHEMSVRRKLLITALLRCNSLRKACHSCSVIGNWPSHFWDGLISVLRLKHFDLISDTLPFGRLWYGEPDAINNAIDYAKLCSRSHGAVIRVYHEAGNVIETHQHKGEFKEP